MADLLRKNRLLAALPPALAEDIVRAGSIAEMPLGCLLYASESRPAAVYLLSSGVASIVFTAMNGTTIEQATEGSEGLIGWANLLGPCVADSSCTMQIAGRGLRIPLPVMQELFDRDVRVRRAVLMFAQHQVLLTKQILACNRLHRAEARLCRWLLMLSDRIASDQLQTTQEFLSNMLGTRRTTVAEVTSSLVKLGALESRRGGLRIVDRALLEQRACECYRPLKRRFERLYEEPASTAPSDMEPPL